MSNQVPDKDVFKSLLPKLWFGFNISKNYAIDIGLLYFYRNLSDGISFGDFQLNWDRYEGDHKPSFELMIAICNFVIIDFEIYNIHHMDRCEHDVTIPDCYECYPSPKEV